MNSFKNQGQAESQRLLLFKYPKLALVLIDVWNRANHGTSTPHNLLYGEFVLSIYEGAKFGMTIYEMRQIIKVAEQGKFFGFTRTMGRAKVFQYTCSFLPLNLDFFAHKSPLKTIVEKGLSKISNPEFAHSSHNYYS